MARWAFWTLAVVFFVAFFGYFHSALLFGTGDSPEGRQRRYYLLGTALTPSPESALVDLGKRMSVTEHLGRRGPLLASAAAIWIVAILAGDAFLAVLLGRRRIGGWTRFVFAFGLGMGLSSLAVLGVGLGGWLRPQTAMIAGATIAGAWVVLRLAVRVFRPAEAISEEPTFAERKTSEGRTLGVKTKVFLLLVMTTFAAFSLLSAFLPTTDYDALGYHLLAPREWFEAGRIFFLPHNVYASFPFLTEMFHLLGMTVVRDWFAGGLVGQVVLWAFGPMGALAVGLLAARWFGSASGWMAATIYLTTPWIFRLSAIPYVEGALLFFGTLALLGWGGMPKRQRGHDDGLENMPALTLGHATPRYFLVGAAVGCAASCKYTALIMLGVPFGVAVVWRNVVFRSAKEPSFAERKTTFLPIVAFTLGVALFFGPWLLRNAVWTGNPVYPLAYSIFGGANWTPEKAAKFAAGHRSDEFSLGSVGRYLAEIPVHSDWQSGLVFALAPIPLALCLFRRGSPNAGCSAVWLLTAIIAWQFVAFYLFTHRLDRFWLPLLPFACVLAGAGWSAFPPTLRGWLVNPLVFVAILFNFCYCTTRYTALNDYTANLMEHRRTSRGMASRAVQLADESGRIPPGAGVLYVGFAGVYYSDHPFLYNSVFDDALLEKLAADPASANGIAPLPELRRRFRERGIHYLVVDWEWIRKYKGHGNYGYSDFVTPERFDELVSKSFIWRIFSEALDVPDETKSTEPKLEIYRIVPELRQ